MSVLKLFFISTLIIHLSYQILLDNNHTEIKCHTMDSTLWKLYNWHFFSATNINILMLLRKHTYVVRNYVSNILFYVFERSEYSAAFTLKTIKMEWRNNVSNSKSPVENIKFLSDLEYMKRSSVFGNENFDRIQKLRWYSGDPYDAYLIIVFDVEELILFITQKQVIRNPRGSYIIIILTPDIRDIYNELREVLRLLWTKHGVLNVQVKLTCSKEYKKTYRFNPFEYFNESWGKIDKFDIDYALENPSKYRNSLKNMQGYPLNMSMFVRIPTAMLNLPKSIRDNKSYEILKKSGGFGGLDGTVLANIAQYLNFSTKIITPPPDREYGFKLNGTIVGSLGDVVYNFVSASFNGRFISKYDSDKIEFLTPISNDFLCLVVPKAEKIPQWMKISHCFETNTWLSILGLYIVISLYWAFANNILFSFHNVETNITDSFFEVLTLFISVPVRKTVFDSEKLFIAICLIFSVIFVGMFQGSLYNSYTRISYFPDINTLEDLDKSGLLISTASKSLVYAFGNDSKPVMNRLRDKILILNGVSSLQKAANDRDVAAMERKADANLLIKTEFTRFFDGFEMLHVMDECPWTYYVSYIVPLGSPFLPLFNALIRAFLEAGLVNKWSTDTVDGLILEKRIHPTDTDSLKPFTLKDIQSAFYLVGLGLLISFFVFLLEIFFYKTRRLQLYQRKK